MSINRQDYPGIPHDFPIEAEEFGLAGVQPKMNLVQEGEWFFESGTAPSEVFDAYEVCEDLAQKFTTYCTKKLQEGAMTKDQILERAYQGLLAKEWCTRKQCLWTIRHAAKLLNWSVPPAWETL